MTTDKAQVVLTLRLGEYGQRTETVALNLPADMARDLTEPMELSDDPLSLLLSSMRTTADAVTVRQRAFKLRKGYAEWITREMVRELQKLFGSDDTVNGYSAADWSESDRRQADRIRGTSKD